MKKLLMLLTALLVLSLASCTDPNGDPAESTWQNTITVIPNGATTAQGTENAEQPDSKPSVTDEFPNEPSEDYSKRY